MSGEPLASRISPIELPPFFRKKRQSHIFRPRRRRCRDAQPVTATTQRPRDYQDEPITSSSRRQKDPQSQPPVARPRTHILIPFAGEATERGTSNRGPTAHMQSADGDRDDLGVVIRKGQASKPQVCLHLWRRVSAYHEKTHGVSGDFLPKLCVKVERERDPLSVWKL